LFTNKSLLMVKTYENLITEFNKVKKARTFLVYNILIHSVITKCKVQSVLLVQSWELSP